MNAEEREEIEKIREKWSGSFQTTEFTDDQRDVIKLLSTIDAMEKEIEQLRNERGTYHLMADITKMRNKQLETAKRGMEELIYVARQHLKQIGGDTN